MLETWTCTCTMYLQSSKRYKLKIATMNLKTYTEKSHTLGTRTHNSIYSVYALCTLYLCTVYTVHKLYMYMYMYTHCVHYTYMYMYGTIHTNFIISWASCWICARENSSDRGQVCIVVVYLTTSCIRISELWR